MTYRSLKPTLYLFLIFIDEFRALISKRAFGYHSRRMLQILYQAFLFGRLNSCCDTGNADRTSYRVFSRKNRNCNTVKSDHILLIVQRITVFTSGHNGIFGLPFFLRHAENQRAARSLFPRLLLKCQPI